MKNRKNEPKKFQNRKNRSVTETLSKIENRKSRRRARASLSTQKIYNMTDTEMDIEDEEEDASVLLLCTWKDCRKNARSEFECGACRLLMCGREKFCSRECLRHHEEIFHSDMKQDTPRKDEDSQFPVLSDYEESEEESSDEIEERERVLMRRRGLMDGDADTESVVSMLSLNSSVSYAQSTGCSFVSRSGNMVWTKEPLPPRARKQKQVSHHNKTYSREKPFMWKRYFEVPTQDVETGVTFVSRSGNLCWRPNKSPNGGGGSSSS